MASSIGQVGSAEGIASLTVDQLMTPHEHEQKHYPRHAHGWSAVCHPFLYQSTCTWHDFVATLHLSKVARTGHTPRARKVSPILVVVDGVLALWAITGKSPSL